MRHIPDEEMVSLMRDWLKPMIEGELELAIEWKRATAGPNKSADADNGPTSSGRKLNRQALAKIYEDDSSNLRAKIERTRLESSVVQVVEVSKLLCCMPDKYRLTGLYSF